MSLPLPPNFVDLNTACSRSNSEVNIMGVVTDFLPPGRSRGTDYMMSFSLTDLSYSGLYDQGLRVRFFKPMESELPAIRGTGDVVLLRFLKIKEWQGMTIGLANRGTSWIVFPAASIPASTSPSSIQLHHFKTPQTPAPAVAEMRYAISLCNSRDRSTYTEPLPTPVSISIAPSPSGAVPANRAWKDKFSLIKDVTCDTYYDLVGQVVKLYPHSNRVELYLSDYTSNNLLWNYEWGQNDGDGSGREGDSYNYVPRNSGNRQWSGPFGKMTLTVTLWPPHGYQNVKENDFVHLRNVHIKWSKDAKLEGAMHSDRRYPDKIDVTILKNSEDDERVKDVLRRKREYMKKFQKSSEEFVAEARGVKRRAENEAKPMSKTAQKKKRKQGRELAKPKGRDVEQGNDKENSAALAPKDHFSDSGSVVKSQKLDLNKNVNCSNHLITSRSLSSILSFHSHANTTPEGTSYTLPFQNINCRATVRVIDFFPADLVDFAVPCPKPSEFACLSDADDSQDENESESEFSDTGSQVQKEDRRWEWRFCLVLEDALGPKGEEKETMQVYVAGQDAECLLKLDAENLRKSPTAVANLREKLVLLWGDLEEQKGRQPTSLKEIHGNSQLVKKEATKSKAFQCCLKEYGVKTMAQERVERRGNESEGDQVEEEEKERYVWERRWRMFGTTIVVF